MFESSFAILLGQHLAVGSEFSATRLGSRQSCFELRTILAFAGFDFGEFSEQFATMGVQEVLDGVLLRL